MLLVILCDVRKGLYWLNDSSQNQFYCERLKQMALYSVVGFMSSWLHGAATFFCTEKSAFQ